MKYLFMTMIALAGLCASAADLNCYAQREWLDNNGNLQKEAHEIPVLGKYPGLVKLELDLEDSFYSINDFEGSQTTLSIVFPPNYTVGTVVRTTITSGQTAVVNSVNGSNVYKLTCRR
ncbi:hypothetical protein [Bacteriovorax sp. DB6_IX]|uniref:hypothetical protein n=1 Tax=Bacteriovorax sp. DB6_IX TaxID=1353530 RepID=UPI00038A1618|nr:hypothetical protein [Bacteriovorax sp. DB6_IX]EQC43144.1 hypothetical protein M901_1224 [Bacteriovorax sp. DB6_IX]